MLLPAGECMGCDVLQGRLRAPGGPIHEQGGWLLDHSVSPCLLRGWLILKPQRHVEHVSDLTDDEASSLGCLLKRASLALERGLGAERVYVLSMGDYVHHVHFYLLPRYSHMPRSGIEVLARMFSADRPWACSDEDAADAAAAVRRQFLSN